MIKLKESMEFEITSQVSYIQIIANQINLKLFLNSFMVWHTVYFKGMMVFTLTSQMYHRLTRATSTWVLVHEYEYKYEYYDYVTHEYEYSMSTRNSVLEYCEYEYWVRVPQPWL